MRRTGGHSFLERTSQASHLASRAVLQRHSFRSLMVVVHRGGGFLPWHAQAPDVCPSLVWSTELHRPAEKATGLGVVYLGPGFCSRNGSRLPNTTCCATGNLPSTCVGRGRRLHCGVARKSCAECRPSSSHCPTPRAPPLATPVMRANNLQISRILAAH